MKRAAILGLALLALGVVILTWRAGDRLSTQAAAVVLGVVAGVAASIPTAGLVVLAMLPRASASRRAEPYGQSERPPAVVVINAPAPGLPSSERWPTWRVGEQPPAGVVEWQMLANAGK